VWGRPAASGPPIPPDQTTQQIPAAGAPPEPATRYIPRQGSPMDAPTQHIPHAGPQQYPATPPPDQPEKQGSRLGRFFKDPLSIILTLVIVVALLIAGLLGTELYARHRADSVVAGAVECVVQDNASVSFGLRPFLLQLMTGHYTGISIKTAGNQIREAKGMKVDLNIDDVQLKDTGDSKGTIGALDATITWSNDGIKQTVQDAIPLFGGVINSVATHPSDGTIELQGGLGTVTAKPQIADGGVTLQVINVTGLGFSLPREIVQPALDAFTSTLTKNYPLGIKADSVAVTDNGVTSQFSTRNAKIPTGQQDPCFAGV
jgi:hypothetical protein